MVTDITKLVYFVDYYIEPEVKVSSSFFDYLNGNDDEIGKIYIYFKDITEREGAEEEQSYPLSDILKDVFVVEDSVEIPFEENQVIMITIFDNEIIEMSSA